MLTKEQILNADDSKTEIVDVSEWWGGEVTIKSMSGFARDRFEASIVGKNGGNDLQNIRAKLVAGSVVDENGELMFSDRDIKKLGNKDSKPLDKIFDAAQKLNKITDSEVDELAKNS